MPLLRSLLLLALVSLPSRGAERALSFEKDVRPIFKARCTLCHGEDSELKGDLDLRLRRFMDKVLAPGDPAHSKLVEMIRSGEMPKKGKRVTDEQLKVIEQWIAQGAKTLKPEPETPAARPTISDEEREYWAFQPVKPQPVPVPGHGLSVMSDGKSHDPSPMTRNPIDAFVLAKLKEQNLPMAPEADRRTLIRRVTMNLTGLPPAPEDVEAFVSDPSPLAYERLVDQLLTSPAYGERWARHWLDVAGYADSNGYTEADSERKHAWRYRDYVIRAFNDDKPWDQFIQEQLAGDELAAVTHETATTVVADPVRRDRLIATAFLRLAPDGTGDANDDVKLARNQVIASEIKIVSSALLGLSVGCAQCHDHRYDPILQTDYYRLRAVFEPAFDWQSRWRPPFQREYSLYTPEDREKAKEIDAKAAEIDKEANALNQKLLDEVFEEQIVKVPEADRAAIREMRAIPANKYTGAQKLLQKKYPSALANTALNLYDEKRDALVQAKRAEAAKLRATKPVESFLMSLTELKGIVPETKLFYRGDHDQPRETMKPGELTVLASAQIEPFKPAAVTSGSSGRRLAYAQWLTSGKHPTVARVLVNRFWLNHFGRGIVNTPGEFGRLGELPTHPELLDWLADEFVKGGWRLKPLQRLILLSRTYRQSSVNAASLKADPENRFYARFKMRRLDAESLRDSVLATTNQLVRTSFGPPSAIGRDLQGRVVPGIDKSTINKNIVEPAGAPDFRRSIYFQVRRTRPMTVLDTFDEPPMTPNCEQRNQSTVAPQSLLMMNDVFIIDNARRLAGRVTRECPGDQRAQLQRVWHLLFGASATDAQIAKSLAYLAGQTSLLDQRHAELKKLPPPPKVVVRPDGRQVEQQQMPAVDPNAPIEALASLCQILYSSNRFLYVE